MDTIPQRIYTTAQIKSIEQQYALRHNGHCYDLMELAGRAVFKQLRAHLERPAMCWVFCGKGNNGGDGYIVASCLKEAGLPHRVFAVGAPREGTEAYTAYVYYKSQGGVIEYELPQNEDQERPEIVVDALLGTGLTSAPRAPIDEWIVFINRLHAYTLAVDIPSGIMSDTGTVMQECVRADATVVMLALKAGLFTADAVDYVGEVIFASLGIETSKYEQELSADEATLPTYLVRYEDVREDLPLRTPSANKSDSGRILLIGGAKGMGGALLIAGLGALRAGAGLVKLALDPLNIPAVNARCPELMTVDYNDTARFEEALDWADVIAIGPGLSQSAQAQELLKLVEESDKYVIYDADALNLMVRLGPNYNKQRIITPHPGEAGRLLGQSAAKVNADRFEAALTLQDKYGGVVLLKGAGTVICNGRRFSIIREGSAALATGGSGDLLTGILAALVGQGLSLHQAALCAACIHGRAGAAEGAEQGMLGTLPTDLLPKVRGLINGRS
ncbi:MAG: NAD(P)H-hydrate dehydratase [Succinivibrio sp.]|nr:NAD(P)H-hydrate dehydratase [Succinivibrio sp.]